MRCRKTRAGCGWPKIYRERKLLNDGRHDSKEPLAELKPGQHRLSTIGRKEGSLKRIPRQAHEFVIAESKYVSRDPVLVGQRRVKHVGVVGVQYDSHPGIEELSHRVLCQSRAATGHNVAGNTDFDRNLLFRQVAHRFRIFIGVQPVSDAVGVQLPECSPNRFRPTVSPAWTVSRKPWLAA